MYGSPRGHALFSLVSERPLFGEQDGSGELSEPGRWSQPQCGGGGQGGDEQARPGPLQHAAGPEAGGGPPGCGPANHIGHCGHQLMGHMGHLQELQG